MSNHQTVESTTMDDLFNEISEDLAETINGGLHSNCHAQIAFQAVSV
ncbi:MAG: hypothetical protein QNJ42_14940 [Crocosphaera sp.]|nr:hypothetical protein [Crocosphaera sp.]